MAVLSRNKSTIFGLNGDLAALTQADLAEKLRAEGEEGRIEGLLTAESAERSSEITRVEGVVGANKTASELKDSELQGNIDTLESTVGANKTDADLKIAAVQANLDAEVAATNSDVSNLNGRIDDVLSNVDAASLDSLTEVVSAFQTADSDLNQAVIDLAAVRNTKMVEHEVAQKIIDDAQDAEIIRVESKFNGEVSTLTSSIATEKLRAEGVEALKLEIASNLSDLADKATSRTNLDVYSKAEVTNGIRLGGAISKVEMITVSSDVIVLAFAPKDGMIFNFATVRHVDASGVAWDIPVTMDATDSEGKTYTLHGDSSGQFDTKSVMVQYQYIALS